MTSSSVRLFKSVVNFKFLEIFSCVQVFCQVEHSYFCTGESNSPLYYCIREKLTVLLICCTPSDLLERVPGAENDQIHIGLEAYSALKKQKRLLLVKEYTAWSFLLGTSSPGWVRCSCFCSKLLGEIGYLRGWVQLQSSQGQQVWL